MDEAPEELKEEIVEAEVVETPENIEELKEDKLIKDDRKTIDTWKPKTELGRAVKEGKITSISEIIEKGLVILEPEIVDMLIPNLSSDLLLIGQSKGKFGGGQRRVFKQTQKKTREGNKPKFATMAVVGNSDGYVGLGYGKAKETVPAREKALRNAKKSIIKIVRGSGSWASARTKPNSIPFKVTAKVGSVSMTLIPAPEGTGLVIQKECAKILKLAGIKDVWSKTSGITRTRHNLVKACFECLRKLSTTKIKEEHVSALCIVKGPVSSQSETVESFVESIKAGGEI